MPKLVDNNIQNILELFQNAYYNQINSRMTIGSEEYTLSSIFTYILSSWSSMLNKSFNNRFLSSAEGEFLDNIASQYNLSRDINGLFNPYFETYGYLYNYTGKKYQKGTYKFTINGHNYYNDKTFIDNGDEFVMRWICTEKHSDYLTSDEIYNTIKDIFDGMIISDLESTSRYITDDNEFRQYIYNNKDLFRVGLSSSFESAVKLSCSNFYDVHCITQDEYDYNPGEVNILVKVKVNNDAVNEFQIPYAYTAIKDLNILPVNNTSLTIKQATNTNISLNIGTLYISNEYTDNSILSTKLLAIRTYLNKTLKIREKLFPSDVVQLLKTKLSDIISDTSYTYTVFGLSEDDYNNVKDFTILQNGGYIDGPIDPVAFNADCLYITDFVYTYSYI